MHEMGVAQQLVQIALDAIPEDIENPKIEKINLKIGKLAAVVESSLTFCFEIITKETALEKAVLNIDFIPVTVHCKSCNRTREVDNPLFQCPFCENGEIELLTGREIEIISIELAEPDK